MKTVKGLTVRKMMVVGLLASISIVLGIVPGLGFIPVGPTRATIMHIPVIIGAIMEGPLVGGLIGLIFGVFSIFKLYQPNTCILCIFKPNSFSCSQNFNWVSSLLCLQVF